MQLLSLQIWESNIHSLLLTKKKKQQKDDHVILVNENRPGAINICLYYGFVFCVEALALRNKKEVEGRRDSEREKILPKKKRGGGGVKASLNDFFAPERR